ncbi:hypothetical protein [Symbiopectobacterium sp. RP]
MRYRDFVLSPYGVIKIKSLGYIAVISAHLRHSRRLYAFLLEEIPGFHRG